MGIYYCAINHDTKEKFQSPNGFSIKSPGIFGPNNPFPNMVVMKLHQGHNFEIIDDGYWEGPFYSDEYVDITEKVYEQYLSYWPLGKDGTKH